MRSLLILLIIFGPHARQFDSSYANLYLDNNKGELQYVYMIFENGGLPTVLTGP